MRREITKTTSFEAECIEASKATMFSEVSMTLRGENNSIFLLSSVGSGSDTLYISELWGVTNKKDTDFRSESSYSSLAQSVVEVIRFTPVSYGV